MNTIEKVETEIEVKKNHRYFSGFLLLLFLSAVVHADDFITTDIIELSAGIGYYDFDADRNLDDSAMASMGLGLHFSRSWAMLLHYSALNTDSMVSGVSEHYDVQLYNVDVHRFFNTENHLRPYIVAGFGQIDLISPSEDINKNMLNAGAGLYYRMTPAWSLRTDVRIYANTNGDYKDNALTLTLGYRFNGGERGD
jgi:hypothetical protein